MENGRTGVRMLDAHSGQCRLSNGLYLPAAVDSDAGQERNIQRRGSATGGLVSNGVRRRCSITR